MIARERQLHSDGFNWIRANGIAWLEERIYCWPPAWGDNLCVFLYGDFEVPDVTLTYPSLGITVHPEKIDNTIITGAMTVLAATVIVKEKSVDALIDAAEKIQFFTRYLHAARMGQRRMRMVVVGNARHSWWRMMKLTHEWYRAVNYGRAQFPLNGPQKGRSGDVLGARTSQPAF